MPRGRGTARGRAAVAKGRCEGRRKRAPWHSGRVSARAARRCCDLPRVSISGRPPARPRPLVPDGRSPRALRCQRARLGTQRRLAEAEQGRTATRRLSPCSRLRAFISSGPRPPWSARLRASPDGQARPGTPRCPAQSARAPAPRVWLVPLARRPRSARPPKPPRSPVQSLAQCPWGAPPWGCRGLGPGVGDNTKGLPMT